jgi:ATP-dependent helicase YprA (DUF1998 family)
MMKRSTKAPSTFDWSALVSRLAPRVPRDFQKTALEAFLSGRNVILTASAGAGKSFIIEMLSMACPDSVCIVIIPLESMMQDLAEQ